MNRKQHFISALQAVDPVANMDIYELQKKYSSQLCLCGNVDVGMLNIASPQKVYDDSRALLEACGAAQGYVYGASNAVQKEIHAENYQAMIHAYRDYCNNSLKRI